MYPSEAGRERTASSRGWAPLKRAIPQAALRPLERVASPVTDVLDDETVTALSSGQHCHTGSREVTCETQ